MRQFKIPNTLASLDFGAVSIRKRQTGGYKKVLLTKTNLFCVMELK